MGAAAWLAEGRMTLVAGAGGAAPVQTPGLGPTWVSVLAAPSLIELRMLQTHTPAAVR